MAQLRLGVYIHQDGPKLGRGKVQLLEAIRDQGSISAAARSMGMAYRHAWVLLDELNRCFAEPVIEASTGGPRGGGARLTPWGEELIERFDAMEQAAQDAIADHVGALEARAKSGSSRARPRRRSKGR